MSTDLGGNTIDLSIPAAPGKRGTPPRAKDAGDRQPITFEAADIYSISENEGIPITDTTGPSHPVRTACFLPGPCRVVLADVLRNVTSDHMLQI